MIDCFFCRFGLSETDELNRAMEEEILGLKDLTTFVDEET
jgi:hypothetical protein